MTWNKVISFCLLIFAAGLCFGQTATDSPCVSADTESIGTRPILSVYSLEIGGSRSLSTYLSPLYYDGTSYALSGSWTKIFNHWPDRCQMRFEAELDVQNLMNPARTATMISAIGRFGWGLMWKKDFCRNWRIAVGPMLDLYGGALYLQRNGNNPVTALASVGIDATASISWKSRFGKLPVIISDELRIPTLSLFFCPEYGESYYEIYLGNRHGLAHCGWWKNAMGIDNLISIKMDFGKTGMMIGYRFDLREFRTNSLQTQLLRNAIVIGVIPDSF